MSVTRPIPTMFFVAVFLMLAIAAVLMLSSVIGRHDRLREHTRDQIRALVARQLALLADGDVEGLRATVTEAVRGDVTPAYVERAKAAYATATAEQLVGRIDLVDKEDRPLEATVHTEDGHKLMHLVRVDGEWLADGLWPL